MVRTLVTPNNQDISIHLPKNYIGKRVEVIAFTIDEPVEGKINKEQTLTHIASENSLAKDWLSTEEDSAWSNL